MIRSGGAIGPQTEPKQPTALRDPWQHRELVDSANQKRWTFLVDSLVDDMQRQAIIVAEVAVLGLRSERPRGLLSVDILAF